METQELASSQLDESDDDLQAKAKRMRVRFVNLMELELDKEVGTIIPEAMARRYKLVCIGKLERRVTLAMADPLDVFAIDDIKIRTGFEVDAVLARGVDIIKAIDHVYGEDQRWKELVDQASDAGIDIKEEKEDHDANIEAQIDQPVIKLTNHIIVNAITKKASDIHIEPFEDEVIVRYRVDGMLSQEMSNIPVALLPAVMARIKIMAALRIDEKRVPQDGRIALSVGGKDLDLRVSTLPSVHGESAVMRILDRSSTRVDLTQLGYHDADLLLWKGLIEKPNGIVLVTGPTGSGKSTTLYATLNVLNTPDSKLLTVEDPVEYNIKGIVQVQTNNKAGLTFARALRAFLRQDPDIIMVGEIRDHETAEIAIHAALTGHLVFSTLHTNDSAGAITRLLDMGVEPFLAASSLVGVVAQRLLRRNCPFCSESTQFDPDALRAVGITAEEAATANFREGKGCDKCGGSGYKGRQGVYELLVIDDHIRHMTVERESAGAIKQYGIEHCNLRTLIGDGKLNVLNGKTTPHEVLRVCQREEL